MKVSRVVVAGVLATALYGACAVPQLALVDTSFAAEEENEVLPNTANITGLRDGSCEKQEVIYASMASTGAVKNLYVVNELLSEAPVMVRDYGVYRETLNLTDEVSLVTDFDNVVCVIEEGSFVYQGNLTSSDLPWNVQIGYELDGVPISAEDLAGKSGELRILIETSQNAAVDPLYFDNYLLQITCTLPMDHARNITTEEGTLALAGSDTSVSFNAMPGKNGSFSLTAQVNDFEMEGISVAAVPFSMAIDAPDSEALVAQFDALIEGADQLDKGAARLNDGVDALDQGAQKLDQGVGELQSGASELSTGMSAYVAGVSQASAGVAQLANSSKQFATQLAQLASKSSDITELAAVKMKQQDREALIGAIAASSTLSDDQKQAMIELVGASAQLGELSKGLSSLSLAYSGIAGSSENPGIDPSLQKLSDSLAQLSQQGGALTSGSTELDAGVNELASSTGGLAQGTSQLANGAAELSDGTSQLSAETKTIPDKLQAEIDAMMADYDKSDFVPQSFVDARNTNVTLVQFVMTTDPITVPDPVIEEPEPEDESFLSRFFALFS